MLLVADIGNSTVRVGGFGDADEPVLITRVPNGRIEEFQFPTAHIEAIVVGSVNPVVASQFVEWAGRHVFCPVYEFRMDVPNPMPMLCEQPDRVGADRILNAIALHRRTGRGGIVVDFGTATSLAAVSPNGEFLGGAIAPGFAMAARALHADTALLPYVVPLEAPHGPGRNTEEAMAIGLLCGMAGMADRIIEHLGGTDAAVPVLATGGSAERIVPFCSRVHAIAPHLTLEGLREAYLRRPR